MRLGEPCGGRSGSLLLVLILFWGLWSESLPAGGYSARCDLPGTWVSSIPRSRRDLVIPFPGFPFVAWSRRFHPFPLHKGLFPLLCTGSHLPGPRGQGGLSQGLREPVPSPGPLLLSHETQPSAQTGRHQELGRAQLETLSAMRGE